jgi:hypothetical protein
MSVLTDSATIEAKAQAELVVVLARIGVSQEAISDLGRILFESGFKLGYASGANDAMQEARETLRGIA